MRPPDDSQLAIATRRAVAALALSQGVLLAVLGLARWASFHNHTFDLAFYVRMAWGYAHNDRWEPLVDAHVFGLHLSPILIPLGWIGRVVSLPATLLIAQAAAIALAAFPLARIGQRHLGPSGALIAAIAWLFYPNLGHVAGYEAHPGTLAVLPIAWLAWSIDRGSVRGLVLSTLGVLACREDLALVTMLGGAIFAYRHRPAWRGVAVGAASLAYALFFFLYLHPAHAPAQGSLQLHFGRFGDSASEVAVYLLTHPFEVASHLATAERLLYVPLVLLPFAWLPLRKPYWLVPALPVLAINLISDWPTMRQLDEHYLTPAIPFFVAGALEGARALVPRARSLVALALVPGALVAHVLAGGTPLSRGFDRSRFAPDEDTLAARAIVARVPEGASVQAADPLLGHLAERRYVRRGPPPEAGTDFVVLDVDHRRRFRANEDLLRTTEEPEIRNWLGREDHRLVEAGGRWMLLEKGPHPRTGLGGRAIAGRADPTRGQVLTACLAILGATLQERLLTLELVARGACASDLAVRIGTTWRPRRVDLLFGGWLSPVHLRSGDHLRSRHLLDEAEAAAIRRAGQVRVGLLRSSGARPEHEDPTAVDVPIPRGS